ncbi:hypothetical protein PINS_up015969 [Pythium insidiosum]|nr:hypothetical protein PINS_up015969 [Pythium insidiosum]
MTAEDRVCVALLFCATFGVGSMSFGAIFAAAGPLVASLAVYFLSACNLHASVAVSKALTVAPLSVRTFSDLGYFAFGDVGRRVVLAAEAGVCVLTPIAFLILGGTTLLPQVFPDITGVSTSQWIVLLALAVLPIVLIPTLRGTGPLCYLGAAAAVLTDAICIGYSLTRLPLSPRETELHMTHIAPTFGTIMFAMGTAIIIPPIQRQHSEPGRLANLVSLTLLFITAIYMLIGIATYYQFGCTAPPTLLDELPSGDWKRLATALMLFHVVVAFPMLLNPTLFDLERYVLGKDSDADVLQQTLALQAAKAPASQPILLHGTPTVASLDDDGFLYGSSGSGGSSGSSTLAPSAPTTVYYQTQSPTGSGLPSSSSSSSSSAAGKTTTPTAFFGDVGAEQRTEIDMIEFTWRDRLCSSVLRASVLAVQTLAAVALQNCFSDILSLIGSTAITVSCMIMPCLCYLKVYPIPTHAFVGRCDRALCYVILVTSTVLGAYCTVVAAGNIAANLSKYELFQPMNATDSASWDGTTDQFPHCYAGERN